MDRQDGGVKASGATARAAARVSPEAFAEAMRGETEQMLREVMGAVNDAPDGAWVEGSEMRVRDVMGEYRRRVYERALQMRVGAAEGAFPPGGPAGGRGQASRGVEEQGAW